MKTNELTADQRKHISRFVFEQITGLAQRELREKYQNYINDNIDSIIEFTPNESNCGSDIMTISVQLDYQMVGTFYKSAICAYTLMKHINEKIELFKNKQ